MKIEKHVRLKELIVLLALSRASIYRAMMAPADPLPKPRRLRPGVAAWWLSDVLAWAARQ